MNEKILRINDKIFTLDEMFNYTADITITTDNDEVHRNLTGLSTMCFGRVGDNVFIYLINGKFIQVNGTKKANKK